MMLFILLLKTVDPFDVFLSCLSIFEMSHRKNIDHTIGIKRIYINTKKRSHRTYVQDIPLYDSPEMNVHRISCDGKSC